MEAGDAAGCNRQEGGEEQEPCCQEEQSCLNVSAIKGSDPKSCTFQVYQVRVDREDEVQEKKKKKAFRETQKADRSQNWGNIASPTQIQNKRSSLKIKKAKQPYNAKRTPSFKARKVATPGTFVDTSE